MLRELRKGEGQRKNYYIGLRPVPPLAEVRITQLATTNFRDHIIDRTTKSISGRLLLLFRVVLPLPAIVFFSKCHLVLGCFRPGFALISRRISSRIISCRQCLSRCLKGFNHLLARRAKLQINCIGYPSSIWKI